MDPKSIPQISLNNGQKIPQFGLGVYLINSDKECEKACLEAIKQGYRHIDTAHIYGNEKGVGSAIKKSKIPRNEFFITTKLWTSDYGEGKSIKEIDNMLKRLDTDYIDLLLLHYPSNDYVGAYKDMEKAYEKGIVKSIGLSNFHDDSLKKILNICKVKPAINQIELHPYAQRKDVREDCKKENIKIEAWYPIGHGNKDLIDNPLFSKLAKKYNKTNAQIILRWHIQEGFIIFPRSTNPIHIKENIEIFDFNLSDEEMEEIRKLDKKKMYVNW